jgi:hypothetical protein
MAGCGKETTQTVPTKWHYKEVRSTCGQTSISGGVVLCDKCRKDAHKAYPQGYRNVPGDICCHGTYVGDEGGIDYLCGQCEDGELWR